MLRACQWKVYLKIRFFTLLKASQRAESSRHTLPYMVEEVSETRIVGSCISFLTIDINGHESIRFQHALVYVALQLTDL